LNLSNIPSFLSAPIAGILGFVASVVFQKINNYIHRAEISEKARVQNEKVESEAGLTREKERETEINGLRESIRGLRDIIAELRVSRDEALEARRLMNSVVETMRGKLADLETEMRRRDEKCEERLALFEQNSEKRIEMLKRQHTEEIAELARQLSSTLRGPKGDPGPRGDPGPPAAPAPRKKGTEPNIQDAVDTISAEVS
jgi:hypothetical protein